MEPNYEDYTEKEIYIEILRELRKQRKQKAKSTAADFGLMNNEDFCHALGISRYKALQIRQSGKLPWQQIGKIIYYRIADVRKFIEDGFITGTNNESLRIYESQVLQ